MACDIPGIENVQADSLSRSTDDHLEWKLNSRVFQNISLRLNISPTIDLHLESITSSSLMYHGSLTLALTSDAFSFSWAYEIIYAFPPFALIDRVVQKIEHDRATGILMFSLWQTQHWFPRLLRLLITYPVIIPRGPRLLYLPHVPEHPHLLEKIIVICSSSMMNFVLLPTIDF